MVKYKATANLMWEFEAEERSAAEAAVAQLRKILPDEKQVRELIGNNTLRFLVKTDKIKTKAEKKVLGKFAPEEVLPFIANNGEKRDYEIDGKTYSVKMNSPRYFIFRSSMKCAACGLEGTHFLLEKHDNDKSPHFNLYAEENGEQILMTKDHIFAKAYGGENRHSNYQTMCCICNNLKGHHNLTLASVRQLRELRDANFKTMSRKKLAKLIDEERQKLAMPVKGRRLSKCKRAKADAVSKSSEDFLILKIDVNIYENDEGELIAYSVYEDGDRRKGWKHLACIRAGTHLLPIGSQSRKISFWFHERECLVYHGLTGYIDEIKDEPC